MRSWEWVLGAGCWVLGTGCWEFGGRRSVVGAEDRGHSGLSGHSGQGVRSWELIKMTCGVMKNIEAPCVHPEQDSSGVSGNYSGRERKPESRDDKQ